MQVLSLPLLPPDSVSQVPVPVVTAALHIPSLLCPSGLGLISQLPTVTSHCIL